MRFLILASAIITATLFSCKKGEPELDITDDSTYEASYPANTIIISKGETYTSDALNHTFPEGVKFSIKEIKNEAGKTSSNFRREYEIGTWNAVVNKEADISLDALLSKFVTKKQTGLSIDERTGAITLLGKATQDLNPDIYTIVIDALHNGQTTTLSSTIKLKLVSGDDGFAKFANAKWKFSNDNAYSIADVTINKLDGENLNTIRNLIPNYQANRTYIQLKIADARTLGIDITKDITFKAQHSIAAVNPWIPVLKNNDAIILSSAIDRFPVLEQDSILSGQISSNLLYNKETLDFKVHLNITSEGVYTVNVALNNHPSKKALWWPSGKEIYIANDLKKNDFTSNGSQWSYERMRWSENFVVFWEAGLGTDPKYSTQRLDIDDMLAKMEAAYDYYYNTLKFVDRSSTKANKYRIQLFINDKSEWLATGAGYDNEVGAMWVNYSAASTAATMAHEVGHTFQYLNACDGNYAFTGNTHAGMFWEQTSQYQASLLYPSSSQVLSSYLQNFIATTHLNLLHEDNRYNNFYHLQYWHMLHGADFVGQLWQKAQKPEDPIEAYKRITNTTQQVFNDEIYDYAKRTLTWDFLNKSIYSSYILSSQTTYIHNTTVNALADGYYQVAPAKCVQNYGFNALRLTVPSSGTVQATFEGIKGNTSYNNSYDQYAGWRWGFVAISTTGTATYGTMSSSSSGTTTFTVPANTSRLYLLVTGAPTQHFRHVWDDNASNDEQYPWKAKFTNTAPTN
ncbi:DUF6055 domain-containing protein [Sphingobacterium sp. LRF_L2]|uniref:DUF6055 domain-containing protein n=1 Tax=Sphingobacterium sp. LRF_L2 TaxID=3369421 RepID=UPI003F632972